MPEPDVVTRANRERDRSEATTTAAGAFRQKIDHLGDRISDLIGEF